MKKRYNKEGWRENILSYYQKKSDLIPDKSIEKPVFILTNTCDEIIDLLSDDLDIVAEALGQTIDATFEPAEYKQKIYSNLKSKAQEQDNRTIHIYADGLMTIRNLFQIDKEFYETNFSQEIESTQGDDYKDKFEAFSKEIQKITTVHIRQLIRLIKEKSLV